MGQVIESRPLLRKGQGTQPARDGQEVQYSGHSGWSDYLKAWCNVVNWDEVNKRFAKADAFFK